MTKLCHLGLTKALRSRIEGTGRNQNSNVSVLGGRFGRPETHRSHVEASGSYLEGLGGMIAVSVLLGSRVKGTGVLFVRRLMSSL
ncbi:unnamed protein product [Lactuca virosa]|uniref:Uncharacterized protein n=1 Tax=Lactuca virosa TaxID=75947 RepID=A0AAU9LXT2_9ASTR|nr:unnamed protein product [Lactuca virosa]